MKPFEALEFKCPTVFLFKSATGSSHLCGGQVADELEGIGLF